MLLLTKGGCYRFRFCARLFANKDLRMCEFLSQKARFANMSKQKPQNPANKNKERSVRYSFQPVLTYMASLIFLPVTSPARTIGGQ